MMIPLLVVAVGVVDNVDNFLSLSRISHNLFLKVIHMGLWIECG